MRLQRLIKKLNWRVYLMELVIVILGISIAYQVNIIYEQGVNDKLELTAIKNLHKENEINIEEFESLEIYRKRITSNSLAFLKALTGDEKINQDSATVYIVNMTQTSTPDLQQEATNFYLGSNYGNANIVLKNELLILKTYLQELMDLSEGYKERKLNDFMHYLRTAVDFPRKRIVRMEKIESLEFRNIVWHQYSDELELNRLYGLASQQLDKVQKMVKEVIEKAG